MVAVMFLFLHPLPVCSVLGMETGLVCPLMPTQKWTPNTRIHVQAVYLGCDPRKAAKPVSQKRESHQGRNAVKQWAWGQPGRQCSWGAALSTLSCLPTSPSVWQAERCSQDELSGTSDSPYEQAQQPLAYRILCIVGGHWHLLKRPSLRAWGRSGTTSSTGHSDVIEACTTRLKQTQNPAAVKCGCAPTLALALFPLSLCLPRIVLPPCFHLPCLSSGAWGRGESSYMLTSASVFEKHQCGISTPELFRKTKLCFCCTGLVEGWHSGCCQV